jgi:hypothetical protein
VHNEWWWLCGKITVSSWNLALFNCVIMLSVSVVVFIKKIRGNKYRTLLIFSYSLLGSWSTSFTKDAHSSVLFDLYLICFQLSSVILWIFQSSRCVCSHFPSILIAPILNNWAHSTQQDAPHCLYNFPLLISQNYPAYIHS